MKSMDLVYSHRRAIWNCPAYDAINLNFFQTHERMTNTKSINNAVNFVDAKNN